MREEKPAWWAARRDRRMNWRRGRRLDHSWTGTQQVSSIMQPHPINKETRCTVGAARKTVLIRGHLFVNACIAACTFASYSCGGV